MKKILLFFFGLFSCYFLQAEELNPPVGCPTIAVTGQPAKCYGSANGSAQITITGGSGNYAITWSNGATNTTSISGLTAGTYTVNVKDNVSGCTVFGAYVVNQPNAIVASETFVNVNCKNQPTGSIDLSVSGGTLPYQYDWNINGTGFGDPQDLNGIPDGVYTVQIKDQNLCLSTRTVTITEPAEVLSRSETHVDANCFGSATGSIDLTVWGGTFPYTYSWSNGAPSQDVSNLTSGGYSCLITDFKGCTANQFVSVSQPPAISGTVSAVDVLCFGSTTGSLSSSIVGGTMPYDYSWQNSTNLFSSNTPSLSNIPADNYQLTITDNHGCTFVTSATVNQPSKLTLSATSVNVTCNGYTNGSINLTPSGGTSPYTFSWTNQNSVSFGTTEDLGTLPAGTYTVVATDFRGCTQTLTRTITEPLLPLTATHTWMNVNCYGQNTGSINVTPNGGTNPLVFSWTNGSISEDISNLLAGSYGYSITDANNCLFTNSVIISQPAAPLTSTYTVTNVNCYGELNGAIDLTPAGGTLPYTYSWVNSTYQMSLTTQDINNLPADTYSYVITDAKACTQAGSVLITQPTLLTSSITGVNILCKGGNNGSIDLTVSGGVIPYIYSWSNGASSQDLSNLVAGTYSVIITDDHNCVTDNQITLTEPNYALSYDSIVRHVRCNNGEDGQLSISIMGGTSPYDYLWSNGSTFPVASDLIAGTYTFLVTDANGCTITDQLIVNQPAPLAMNEIITPVTCYGLSNGKIDVNPTGGTTPYSYTWFNSLYSLSAQEQDLVDFPSDTFQLEILDSNSCFYEMFWFLPQPTELEASFSSDNVNCAGGADGSILIDVAGGNGGYTYLWSNGATSEDIIDIPVGTYHFMVTDSKACQDSLEVQIFQPEPVAAVFDVTPVLCKDQYNGAIVTHAHGGTGNYVYQWSTGSTQSNIDGLPTATYTLHVEDVIGCQLDTTVFVDKINEFCVFPPNAFTPNGDNYNDTWVIDNMEVYDNAQVQVFNKWGNLVYDKKGLYDPWDGKISGEIAPTELYYYIIYLNNSAGDKIKGSVTILK